MAGMPWRRFICLVAGLSPDAAWLRWRRQAAKTVPPMTAEQTNSYMRLG